MKWIPIMFFLHCSLLVNSQNCNYLKTQGDSAKYKACLIGESAEQFYNQFSREYQQMYDSAIESSPNYAIAYHAKSVAYLKSGNFIEWKKLIDKAVDLSPQEYLGYRASCRFQFVHDFKGAIRDIEKLKSLVDYDIGYTANGDYHLEIVNAICYKKLGDHKKAIKLFESKLNEKNYDPGMYDYYHLGVLLIEENQFMKAIDALQNQIKLNKSAEVYYQLALAYKGINEMETYSSNLYKAKKNYLRGNIMKGVYTSYIDKIYLKDIMDEIEKDL